MNRDAHTPHTAHTQEQTRNHIHTAHTRTQHTHTLTHTISAALDSPDPVPDSSRVDVNLPVLPPVVVPLKGDKVDSFWVAIITSLPPTVGSIVRGAAVKPVTHTHMHTHTGFTHTKHMHIYTHTLTHTHIHTHTRTQAHAHPSMYTGLTHIHTCTHPTRTFVMGKPTPPLLPAVSMVFSSGCMAGDDADRDRCE